MDNIVTIKKIINILSKPTGTIIVNKGSMAFKNYSGFLVYSLTKKGRRSKSGKIVCSRNELAEVLNHTKSKKIKTKVMAFILGDKNGKRIK